jgi:hypothetical protein
MATTTSPGRHRLNRTAISARSVRDGSNNRTARRRAIKGRGNYSSVGSRVAVLIRHDLPLRSRIAPTGWPTLRVTGCRPRRGPPAIRSAPGRGCTVSSSETTARITVPATLHGYLVHVSRLTSHVSRLTSHVSRLTGRGVPPGRDDRTRRTPGTRAAGTSGPRSTGSPAGCWRQRRTSAEGPDSTGLSLRGRTVTGRLR